MIDLDGNDSIAIGIGGFGLAASTVPGLGWLGLGVATIWSIIHASKIIDDTLDKVRSTTKTQSQPIPKKSENKHNVYTLSNKNSGKVEYVGRTKSIENATYSHQNNPARTHLKLDPIARDVSKETARGLEQMLIIDCRTLNRNNPINNQINGVALKNVNYLIYWDAAETWKLENELPCR